MRDHGEEGTRSGTVLAVLLIISILLMIFTRILDEEKPFRDSLRFLPSIQSILGTTAEGLKNTISSLQRMQEVRKQYEATLKTLSEYQGMERKLVALQQENLQLKKQLGYSLDLKFKHIPSRVIAGDPSNLFASLTVDKGTRDGIRVGMIVTAFQDGFFGLVGKVETVSTHSSQVRPLVDPNHYVAARMEKSRYEGLIQGRGDENGHLLMRYVRKTAGAAIAINDIVITSGMQSIYPRGIFIGRVRQVRSREYASSLEIMVEPIIDIKRIEYLFILGETL